MATFVRSLDDKTSENVAEGAEPTEEVGPGGCEARPGQCETTVNTDSGESAGEAEFSIRSEIDEAFAPHPDVMVPHPEDGMPVPADEGMLAIAPAFTRENVVCIEDTRQFVEVFEEERRAYEGLHGSIEPRLSGKLEFRSRYDGEGREVTRHEYAPERVERRWGIQVIPLADREGPRFVLVRPVRERCCFYRRQLFSNDSQPNPKEPGHKLLFENCTMRRSVGGAFLSISNEAVYACDYRSPPDPGSVERELDLPLEKKLRERPDLVHLPLLGLG